MKVGTNQVRPIRRERKQTIVQAIHIRMILKLRLTKIDDILHENIIKLLSLGPYPGTLSVYEEAERCWNVLVDLVYVG